MQVTVLGCGAAFPRAGGACAGFLVESGGTNVWIDAGNGTFSKLQEVSSYQDVDALVLTHGHADHISDVLPLMYALGFDDAPRAEPLPVFAPPEVPAMLSAQLGGTSGGMFRRVFDFRPISVAFAVGELRFEPFKTRHPAETYGLRITNGQKVVVYTSDTAAFPELADLCRDADLLVCEATYVEGVKAEPGIHMWAREAGEVAAKAGAKRLVLTHVWATLDPEQAAAEASKTYGGPAEAALEGRRYKV